MQVSKLFVALGAFLAINIPTSGTSLADTSKQLSGAIAGHPKTASRVRRVQDVAADQAAVSALTMDARGPGITISEAIVYNNYALTTYKRTDDLDRGQCILAWQPSGWYTASCTGGWFLVADIQKYGTVPYYIAYTLAKASAHSWPNEQQVDAANGTPLPLPPPCSPDEYGYCIFAVTNASSTVCGNSESGGQSMSVYFASSTTSYSAVSATWMYVDDGNCNPTPSWQGPSPYDVTGDPLLPGGGEDSSGAPRG